MASGSALIAVIALADTLGRRREIGRRRALGITRSGLLLLTAARALIPAGAGVTLGGATGWLLAARLGTAPPPDFVIGVAVLAIVGTALFTAVPAAIAAGQDPVRILRTP